MRHYVYRLDDPITGEYYFGSRSCECNPENDEYMGSMKTWKPNKANLIKTIVKSDFKDRETATEYERVVIIENIKHELNKNFSIPGKHSYKLGYVAVKDENDNYYWISNKDERYLSGELTSTSTGVVMSEETKHRISETLQSQMSNMSESEKKEKFGSQGDVNPMFGVRRSDEWKLEQRQRMIDYYKTHDAPRKGATHTKEAKQKLSEFRKEYYKTHVNCNKGKPMSDEQKKKISESKRGQGNKQILQYSKSGEFIKEWDSIKSASSHMGVTTVAIICCLTGKSKTSAGYKWQYK